MSKIRETQSVGETGLRGPFWEGWDSAVGIRDHSRISPALEMAGHRPQRTQHSGEALETQPKHGPTDKN